MLRSLKNLNQYHFLKTVLLCLVTLTGIYANAQCPPNIDFEQGDFRGWQCWTGTTADVGGKNVITWTPTTPVTPVPGRHTMLNAVPSSGRDPYGNFPVSCPNGSGHSIKLGNNSGGAQAEGVSYTFTIPAGQDRFSLIYNYAVVFQDPGHAQHQQPQLQIEIRNLTDAELINCSSFSFIATGGLPGFFQSANPGGPTPVWCKNWSAASINLDGNAGKTIQLFFKTADCTFSAHFGYAYIDVNTQCSSSFTGAAFCPDDTSVTVTGPYGYQQYQWWNGTFTTMLGTTQSLTLTPPPLSGDSINVILTPYAGYGCIDTLTAYLWDTLTINANAGPDVETCNSGPVQIGSPPEPGRVYKWTPTTGLSDPNISNPIASPAVNTTYTLTVTNNGGGCATQDQVKVDIDVMSDSIQQIGPSSFCTSSGQTVSLRVLPHDSVQWYRNGIAITGAIQTTYNVTQSGAYHAIVFSSAGCKDTTAVKQIDIWESPVAGFSTAPDEQCFKDNQFLFVNSSTLNTGILQYAWDLGDGSNTVNTRNVTYNYTKDGFYNVKLLVTAPGGCTDSAKKTVIVNPSPVSSFIVDVPEQCFKNHRFSFTSKSTVPTGTLAYVWDFGDNSFNNIENVTHNYATPGTYNVKLKVRETVGGCTDSSTVRVIVNPTPVIDFSANSFTQCFPGHNLVLQNNTTVFSGGLKYLWSFGDGITDTAASPVHKYKTYGPYVIKLVADAGGLCSDSIWKNAELYPVPEPDFSIQSVCQDLRVPVINRTTNISNSTVNYFWDFGNGHLENTQTPNYAYPAPGNYKVTLRVSTAQCPVSFNTISKNVDIENRIVGIRYPDKEAAYNFPLQLQARSIGNNAIWNPSLNLSNRFSYSPVFKGLSTQLYAIQLKTPAGCVTTDTQLVRTYRKIDIYVPNGFTPGNDNINERLKPALVGFSKVNYFRIYNRWGKLLYSSNSDQPGWDGKFNGVAVNMQTVVWMIEAIDVDGVMHRKQGTTVVIR